VKSKIGILAGSFFAGLANGLFGSGGGLLVLPVLTRQCRLEPQCAHATALMVTLPLSLITIVITALRMGLPDLAKLGWVSAGMVLGSAAGAGLLRRISGKWLRIAVCIAMASLGVKLLL
jgi:uncharacterized membrane protein YfcA